MLKHRLFCRSWHNQVTYFKRILFEHAPQPRQHTIARSFRNGGTKRSNIHPTPIDIISGSGGSVPTQNLVKAFVFTGTFSLGCFMGATILEYENTRSMMLKKAKQTGFTWFRKNNLEAPVSTWIMLKNDVARYWDMLTPGEKVFVPLCALNLIVFGLWRVPSLRSTMLTYFASNPASRVVCWPMFLSTFSHYSAMHIFANMYVLHSFSNAAVMSLGKEQFLAVYLSAGVISTMASVFYKAISAQAGISLGASGAIMAILAYVCSQYPDTQLSVLFLPMITFSAGSAIKVIMGLDFAGCLLGWRFFDHAAHLGGAMYGIFWAYFGSLVWAKRITFLNYYHDFRKKKSP